VLYSTYRNLTWTVGILVAAFLGISFSLIFSPGVGLVTGIVWLGVVVLIGWVWLAGIRARIQEYGGAIPMPGWWGVMGVDIEDDEYPYGSSSAVPAGAVDLGVGGRGSGLSVATCPYCGARLPSPGVRFCNDCGQRLPTSGASPGAPPSGP
jgi:hypothetical protein